LLTPFAGDIPVNFLVDWIDQESGGNPCSRGFCTDASGNGVKCDSPTAVFNREAGIFQTDHPGDDRFGATSPQLRVTCVGTTQTQTRPLTLNEQLLHVKAGINYVQFERSVARSALAAVGARWPETSADFWMLVKSRHGLKTIATELLPVVARKLGRAPISWTEFVNTYTTLPGGAIPASLQGFFFSPSTAGRRNRLDDVIANAENVGRNAGPRIPSTGFQPEVPLIPETSGAAKFALGFVAIAGLAGLGWLALRVAKRVAQGPGMLGAVDEKLIQRMAQLLSYDVDKKEIRDRFVNEGYSDEDVYLAYKAAQMYLKHQDEPLPHEQGLGALPATKIEFRKQLRKAVQASEWQGDPTRGISGKYVPVGDSGWEVRRVYSKHRFGYKRLFNLRKVGHGRASTQENADHVADAIFKGEIASSWTDDENVGFGAILESKYDDAKAYVGVPITAKNKAKKILARNVEAAYYWREHDEYADRLTEREAASVDDQIRKLERRISKIVGRL
jgi:hypothetical protein